MKIIKQKLFVDKIDIWDIWNFITVFILVIPDGIGQISPMVEKLVYRWGLYVVYIGIFFMFVIKVHLFKTFSETFVNFGMFMIVTVLILFFKGDSLGAWFRSFSTCLFVILSSTKFFIKF